MGRPLKRVDQIRDLGVIHDSKLTYEYHVDYIVKKANRTLGFVKRSCSQFKTVKIVKILYCSYVWNPQYNIYVDRIECVQRKLMRYLQFKSNIQDIDYEARCKRHHILPLKERRDISDLNLLAKIAQSQVDSPQLLSKIGLQVPTRTVRHPVALHIPRTHTKYRRNSYFTRAAVCYNVISRSPDIMVDLFNIKPHKLKKILAERWFAMVS
ncbi:hypothetical protein ABMA28_015066 [Loxostege sticticalis]|uniref:Uncharacterized protein n=1 Tax=Loxostege sticticalis TaxID=481309 RepID=A0ABD0TE68_LOXSC